MTNCKELKPNLDQLKSKIMDAIHKTTSEYSETKTNTSYIVNKENFEALKHSIDNDLNVLFENNRYKIDYYLLYREFYKDYIVSVNILDDFEKIDTIEMNFTIKTNHKKTFYCYDVAHIPLKDFLTKNKFESEIVYFINELVDFEVEYTLDEGWLSFNTPHRKPEQDYYNTLDDSEKKAFAKGHGYTYAMSFLYKPLGELFSTSDIDMINSLFNKIEFKY